LTIRKGPHTYDVAGKEIMRTALFAMVVAVYPVSVTAQSSCRDALEQFHENAKQRMAASEELTGALVNKDRLNPERKDRPARR
jgi:hypothetical protein